MVKCSISRLWVIRFLWSQRFWIENSSTEVISSKPEAIRPKESRNPRFRLFRPRFSTPSLRNFEFFLKVFYSNSRVLFRMRPLPSLSDFSFSRYAYSGLYLPLSSTKSKNFFSIRSGRLWHTTHQANTFFYGFEFSSYFEIGETWFSKKSNFDPLTPEISTFRIFP